MSALDLFEWLGAHIGPAVEAEYGTYNGCILATRLAVEVAQHFGIRAVPVPVRVIVMNAQFAKHVAEGDADVHKWAPVDGSHSVGIGCGFADGQTQDRWDGHLITVAEGFFGDFSIRQAERPEKGIVTGPAVVGPLGEGSMWMAVHPEHGTVLHYSRINSARYRFAPDWRDEKRRRKMAGPLIRAAAAALR